MTDSLSARLPESAPLVFVSVGTDHHPFNRLIGWIDGWLQDQPQASVRCLVQSGASRFPSVAQGAQYLDYRQMSANLREATAFVCHGGPATIMDGRDAGLKPIVVPRSGRLGEHVDNHQMVFSARLEQSGQISLAVSEEHLRALLDDAIRTPHSLRLDREQHDDVLATVGRFGDLVDTMMMTRRRRRPRLVMR